MTNVQQADVNRPRRWEQPIGEVVVNRPYPPAGRSGVRRVWVR